MNARMNWLFILGIIVAGGLSAAIGRAEPTEKEVAAMQGTWAIDSFTLNGEALPADQLQNWRRIVVGKRVTWKNGEETMIETEMKFDPSQKPMTLDSTIATGDAKGKIVLAIYELGGGILRVCFAEPDKPRPTEFSSTVGSGQSIYIARRLKE